MALTKCKECNSEVSSMAGKCPSCGIKNPGLSKEQAKRYKILFAVGFLALFIAIYSSIELPEEKLYSGSANFLKNMPQLGILINVENTADWAQGKRQWVFTDNGNFLFYLKGNEVVTVYQETESGRQEIWRKSDE